MGAIIKLNDIYIKQEMEKRGITSINELARRIGISESMLNLIIRGERNPGAKVIGAMIDYFDEEFEKIFKIC